jgi:hypothetical protein
MPLLGTPSRTIIRPPPLSESRELSQKNARGGVSREKAQRTQREMRDA